LFKVCAHLICSSFGLCLARFGVQNGDLSGGAVVAALVGRVGFHLPHRGAGPPAEDLIHAQHADQDHKAGQRQAGQHDRVIANQEPNANEQQHQRAGAAAEQAKKNSGTLGVAFCARNLSVVSGRVHVF
jgi:hypothetical protein